MNEAHAGTSAQLRVRHAARTGIRRAQLRGERRSEGLEEDALRGAQGIGKR